MAFKTTKQFEAIEPRAQRFEVGDDLRPGLRMIVHPSGKKSWIYRYRDRKLGKQFGIVLGDYASLNLAAAREAARERATQVASGRNPIVERIEDRRKAGDEAKALLLADKDFYKNRFKQYEKGYIKKKLFHTTADSVTKLFERDVEPVFGKLRIGEIKRSKIEKLLANVLEEKGPAAANKLHSWLHQFFRWFENKHDEDTERPILAHSPMRGMEKPAPEVARTRTFSEDELRWFWLACEADYEREFELGTKEKRKVLKSSFGAMLQLILLNATRPSEIRCMVESEFDRATKILTIPGIRTKNGHDHEIPLAPKSTEILRDVPRVMGEAGYVFSTNGKTPLSGLSKSVERIAIAMERIAREEAKKNGLDPAKIKIDDWELRDLRRTANTFLVRLKIPIETRKRCLNQYVGDKLEKHYNQHDYVDEKRTAFARWADHLESIVTRKPAKILPMRRGA